MKSRLTQIDIPNGYTVETHQKTVEIDCAVQILLSRKRHRITSAVRIGDWAELTWHSVRCPYCGKESPAYKRFSGVGQKKFEVSKSDIRRWGARQMSLFPSESDLYFNFPISNGGMQTCSKCGKTSGISNRTRRVSIREDKMRLTVSCEVQDLTEIRDTFALANNTECFVPKDISITFNIRNGHTFVSLRPYGKYRPFKYDLTALYWKEEVLNQLPLKIIASNRAVARIVQKYFQRFWTAIEFPFSKPEFEISTYFILTRFVGYPRSFFDAVPYNVDTAEIDRSFLTVIKKLHFTSYLPKLYKNTGLHNMKSLRRFMFNNPEFFFYYKEIRKLQELVTDPNLLCHLLQSKTIFINLSALHAFPNLISFYEAVRDCCGTAKLCRLLDKQPYRANEYGIKYISFLPCYQTREQKRWDKEKKLSHIFRSKCFFREHFFYSIPICNIMEGIDNCVISGFLFKWIRSKMDYEKAGRELNNCLCDWGAQSNPVMLVSKGGHALAAIEVKQDKSCLALGKNNSEIDEETPLGQAITTWRNENHLQLDIDETDYLDYFDAEAYL